MAKTKTAAAPGGKLRKAPTLLNGKRKKTLVLLTMVLPTAIWLILLRYLPMGGIMLAFRDYKLDLLDPSFVNSLMKSKWVGFENFKFLFKTKLALQSIRNTVCYNLLWIVLNLVISVALAIMLNEVTKKFFAKAYQTMMFFPYFLSWVVVSYFVLAFLDPTSGMITHMQRAAGQTPTSWYMTKGPWPVILTICSLWKGLGYSVVLYLSAITGIDSTQYEAAAIDGATKWQQIRYVTLPHLKTIIIILFIMNIGKIFNADFGLFYNVPLDNGPLYPVTMVIDTYVYNTFMNVPNLGFSAAAGVLQSVVGFIFIVSANAIVRKVDRESSLF